MVISSPTLGSKTIHRLIGKVDSLLTRGVCFLVSALSPESYPEDGREHHVQLIRELLDAGIRVITHLHCHTRFAIIDQSIVWYGSMNLLSNPKDDDNLMRIVSPEIAQELLELGCVGKE